MKRKSKNSTAPKELTNSQRILAQVELAALLDLQMETNYRIQTLRSLVEGDEAPTSIQAVLTPLTPKGGLGTPEVVKVKRTMSAAARKRIGAAQKKRWAEHAKQQALKNAPPATKKTVKKAARKTAAVKAGSAAAAFRMPPSPTPIPSLDDLTEKL